ncbi:4-hydroxy-tetrahydrodipicolinate synthase [Sporomusa silvacetica DSM 10669]|uniref:4-hydroxy-tetrahydrodipicolinate synthase n=1 Tax=Sporomusa silvacetica DSM 10669 TaxID=1123289 RepID=A0ABZ3IUQ1_9FIRM|nr:dihydrodipicolinate synthase family protein [Sporomusa silvacetica]OZC19531.1 4-hydroxy-tetrahydrodipicolinate synthase [Sporomusa silvacetica DSM 10669]
MQELKNQLNGIYVLAVTPMKDNFELDMSALRRNIDHFITSGINGVVVGGTYAEYPSMSIEERKVLFTTAVNAVAGRVPIICCTAASGTEEAIQLTKFAQEVGADGVMVTPPYVSEVRSRDMIYHFEQLDAAVDMPILIYNSTSIGVHLTPQDIAELAKLKNVLGVKQGATDLHVLVRTQAYAGHDISVMCASDGIILGALAIGYPGCTSTNANFMASEFVSLYNEVKNGELKKAQKRFYRWQPMRDMATKYGQPAMVKAGMELMGLPSGPVRAPFRTLDAAAKAEIKVALENSGILK